MTSAGVVGVQAALLRTGVIDGQRHSPTLPGRGRTKRRSAFAFRVYFIASAHCIHFASKSAKGRATI